MKRMLINATHSEEIRVALADGQKLYNLDIDIPGQERKKGNIYKGRITRVEPSLEAAFVDYGGDRHGFLPYKEISRNYYTDAANKMKDRPPISVAVKEGTEVIIQVNKEERGNKGAAISTYISLAGRYLVYMPENPKAGGISRRIEGKARQDLKDSLNKVTQPENSGVIVRTAGIGRTAEELDWDLNYLDQVWTAIKTVAATRKAPAFLYQETDIFIRALRDNLRPDVGEILIDNKEIYEKARDFMQQVMPHNLKKLSYYNDNIPLFSRYQIESQIQSAFSREVHLPSGGSLVIDHTEALISIDINSARATKGADIEETALNTNLEAADEIARQLRIRDLGGLVVIDFIDMRNTKNQRSVEQQLNEAVSNDRARIQTSKISRFGLLEMSRQRLKSSINESSQFACPRCSGHGFIRNIESLSVSILRILEEEALKPGTGKVIAQVPTKVANFILNEKREELNNLESRHSVPMLIVANEFYQSPQYNIKRLKQSEADQYDINNIELIKPENEEEAENKSSHENHETREKAAVDGLVPTQRAPVREEKVHAKGFSGWLKSLFSSNSKPAIKDEPIDKEELLKSDIQNKPQTNYNKKPNTHLHKKPYQKNQTDSQGPNKKPVKKKPVKKKPVHKKPVHNHPVNTNAPSNPSNQAPKNQPADNNKTASNQADNNKPKSNKPVNKKPANQQTQKPQNQVNQQNKQPQSKKEVVDNKVESKVVEEKINNEQMLQRPLGSVASYAKNKAKLEQNNDTQKSANSPKQDTSDTSAIEKKPVSNSSDTNKTEKPLAKSDNKPNTEKPKNDIQLKAPAEPLKGPVNKKVDANNATEAKGNPKIVETSKVEIKPTNTVDAKSKSHDSAKTASKAPDETKAKSKATPKPKATPKTKSKTQSKAKPKAKSEAEAKPKPDNQVKTNEATKTESESKATEAPKPKRKTKAKPKPTAKPKVEAESRIEDKTKVEIKSKGEDKPRVVEKPIVKEKPMPKAENKSTEESKPKSKPKPKPKVDDKPIVQPKPSTKPKKPIPDPTSGIDFDI